MRAKDLAIELEVSYRTILRDINALSFAGVPIYSEGGHGGGISLDENYGVKLNGLKETEVKALIASNNASILSDIGLEDAAEQSLLKLLTALPMLYEESAKQFQNQIHIDSVGWWHSAQSLKYLKTIQTAIYKNRLIEIRYQRHDGTQLTRIVQPYGLVAKASVWYLIAKHEGKFRNYRISRIYEVDSLDTVFIRDVQFNLAEYWRASTREFLETVSFFTFTLEIHPDKKNFVLWYAPGFCELIDTTENGWLVAQFYLDSLELAARFVLGLGKNVNIIEPDSLREAVAEKIQQIIDENSQ